MISDIQLKVRNPITYYCILIFQYIVYKSIFGVKRNSGFSSSPIAAEEKTEMLLTVKRHLYTTY